jgi:diaminopropionate ammonia-lyase
MREAAPAPAPAASREAVSAPAQSPAAPATPPLREAIKWTANTMPHFDGGASLTQLLSPEEMEKVRVFHRSIPGYLGTPLAKLDHLASYLGVKGFYVKDESQRFNLKAFKVLGASYAVARYIAQRLGRDISELSYEDIISPATKAQLGEITFYAATDGNHGRAVAWAARQLGQKSVICMPAGSSQARLESIQAEGAKAWVTELNYDDAIRYVSSLAAEDPHGVVIQDTTWPGYEDIPGWIIQGYSAMAAEADEQLRLFGEDQPTHVFVQAGVGAMAGAVQGYYANTYGEHCPITTIVEASAADCIYRSALANKQVAVGGELSTMMAGLACGEACSLSWDVLKARADFFVSAPDWVTARGMRVLAAPLRGDEPVISGESGAVGVGLASVVLTDPSYSDLRTALGLGEHSVIMCFSTEGNTDPETWRSIVWDGLCPSYQ